MEHDKILEIIERIILAYQKSKAAGEIAISPLYYIDTETRSSIMHKLASDVRLPFAIRKSLNDRIGRQFQKHLPSIDKNMPVKQLIQWCCDKKSGKVSIAVRQLKERFLHLDYKDQKWVITVFLDKSVSYRKWCYKTLRQWREPLFDDTLVSHWHQYHDDACLDTIVEVLPAEKVKSLFPVIRIHLNNYKYCKLIKRFGKENWLVVDKAWLLETSSHILYYLQAMSYYWEPLSEAECRTILYDYLQDEFSSYNEYELWEMNERYEDENHNTPPMSFHFDEIRLESPNNNILIIGEFLKLFARMGHYELIVDMISWGYSINRLLPTYNDSVIADTDDKPIKEACKKRFLNYIQLLRTNMPMNFEGIDDYSSCEINSVIDECEVRLKENSIRE